MNDTVSSHSYFANFNYFISFLQAYVFLLVSFCLGILVQYPPKSTLLSTLFNSMDLLRGDPRCSTYYIMDKWTKCLEYSGLIDKFNSDFAKAFDKVPHKRSISKL